MKAFIILLFTLIFAFHVKGDYSIDSLIDYLRGNGYYEIIEQVKINFGDDIAIDFCKELVRSYDCETVVRVYMIYSPKGPGGRGNFDDIVGFIEDSHFTSEIQQLLQKADKETCDLIYTIISNYDILKQTMSNDEILIFIKNIIFKKSSKKQ